MANHSPSAREEDGQTAGVSTIDPRSMFPFVGFANHSVGARNANVVPSADGGLYDPIHGAFHRILRNCFFVAPFVSSLK